RGCRTQKVETSFDTSRSGPRAPNSFTGTGGGSAMRFFGTTAAPSTAPRSSTRRGTAGACTGRRSKAIPRGSPGRCGCDRGAPPPPRRERRGRERPASPMTARQVRVLIASALEPSLVDRIRAVDARLDVVYRAELLGRPRYPGDHTAPVTRTPAQVAEWSALV